MIFPSPSGSSGGLSPQSVENDSQQAFQVGVDIYDAASLFNLLLAPESLQLPALALALVGGDIDFLVNFYEDIFGGSDNPPTPRQLLHGNHESRAASPRGINEHHHRRRRRSPHRNFRPDERTPGPDRWRYRRCNDIALTWAATQYRVRFGFSNQSPSTIASSVRGRSDRAMTTVVIPPCHNTQHDHFTYSHLALPHRIRPSPACFPSFTEHLRQWKRRRRFFVIVAMTLQWPGKKNLRAKGRPRHFAIITFHRVQGSALPKEVWNPPRVPHSIKWITRRPITHQHDYAKSSCGDNRCHPAMP